eukprot:COSAG06_NODE_24320_length_666_cov_0.992945_1_plen_58_part_10
MAYFNNAFQKTFVASSVDMAGSSATSVLTAGELALVDGKDWKSLSITNQATPAAGDLA